MRGGAPGEPRLLRLSRGRPSTASLRRIGRVAARRRARYSPRVWFGSREETARRLEAEAFEALEAGEWEAAEARGDELLAMGWSGGFEVKALAAQGRGEVEVARHVLEDGVEKAPGAWPLWLLLGNVRSDLGRFDEALDAFERALRCEGSDAASVRFNRAVAQHRRGEPGAALRDLDVVLALPKPPPFAEEALALAADCLASLGRGDEAVSMVRAAYERCAESDPRRPRLAAELAVALDRHGACGEAAALFAAAAGAGVATASLLALGRRLRPLEARAPRLFRLVMEAPHPGVAGVLRVLEIAADDVAQALEAARVYVPHGATLHEHEDCGEASGEPGVRWASGLVLFDHE